MWILLAGIRHMSLIMAGKKMADCEDDRILSLLLGANQDEYIEKSHAETNLVFQRVISDIKENLVAKFPDRVAEIEKSCTQLEASVEKSHAVTYQRWSEWCSAHMFAFSRRFPLAGMDVRSEATDGLEREEADLDAAILSTLREQETVLRNIQDIEETIQACKSVQRDMERFREKQKLLTKAVTLFSDVYDTDSN